MPRAMSLSELIPVLQIAVGPVILISGVGLLLLSMTNRFGRVIDRTRAVTRERRAGGFTHGEAADNQMSILLRRAHLLRAAIALSTISVLLAAFLVIVLFLSAVLQLALAGFVIGLFVSCLMCLITALILFIADINLSLNALKVEIRDAASQ